MSIPQKKKTDLTKKIEQEKPIANKKATSPIGWECPRCHAINAPGNKICENPACKTAKQPKTTK